LRTKQPSTTNNRGGGKGGKKRKHGDWFGARAKMEKTSTHKNGEEERKEGRLYPREPKQKAVDRSKIFFFDGKGRRKQKLGK